MFRSRHLNMVNNDFTQIYHNEYTRSCVSGKLLVEKAGNKINEFSRTKGRRG